MADLKQAIGELDEQQVMSMADAWTKNAPDGIKFCGDWVK